MTKRMRLVSLLLAAAVLFVMLFSVAFIAAEADHDCTGEHCPVCYQLSVCENALKRLSLAVAAVSVATAVACCPVLLGLYAQGCRDGATLVSLKVKLSD